MTLFSCGCAVWKKCAVTVFLICGIVFVTEIPFRISRHIRKKLKAKRNGI